jgi:heat shock protein HtpX
LTVRLIASGTRSRVKSNAKKIAPPQPPLVIKAATYAEGREKTMNQIKTILLLSVLSAVLIGLGGLLGPGYLYGFTALALIINFVSYFFSDRIVLAMHRAQEIGIREAPALHRMVEEISKAAAIPKPRVFLIPEAQPNAFATGRNPENGVVAVTSGIVELLNERELRGVIAHEIAHIKNRDILVATIAAGIATAVTYIAHAAQFAAIFGGNRDDEEDGGSVLGSIALAVVAPIAATLIQLGISRSREYLADETAARLTGEPDGLARALEKLQHGAERIPANVEPATASLFIVSPLAGRGSLLGLFSTHPPMEERIARLRGMTGHLSRAVA